MGIYIVEYLLLLLLLGVEYTLSMLLPVAVVLIGLTAADST